MTTTIAAMFDSYADAREAVTRLEAAGIPHDRISIVSNDESHKQYHDHDDSSGAGTGATLGTLLGGGAGLLAGLGLLAIPGLGPVVAAGWLASTALGAGVGAAAGGLVGALTDAGVDEADAQVYAEGVRRGGTLVTVRADEAMADTVADILDDDGTIDMDERERSWRSEGWTGPDRSDATASGAAASTMGSAVGTTGAAALGTSPLRTQAGSSATSESDGMSSASSAATRNADGDEVIPIVEEQLRVGKRQVDQGRVRVRSYTVETPVKESVNLRQEHVSVERRPVDRAVTGADERLFQDRTIEADERAEEAVVSKDARVREEVVIHKDVEDRTERVSDTVRRTEVDIDDDRSTTNDPSRPSQRSV